MNLCRGTGGLQARASLQEESTLRSKAERARDQLQRDHADAEEAATRLRSELSQVMPPPHSSTRGFLAGRRLRRRCQHLELAVWMGGTRAPGRLVAEL